MDLKAARRWGLDFGNVLVANIPHEKRAPIGPLYEAVITEKEGALSVLDRYLWENSKPLDGALEGVRALVQKCGAENVFIVSRADGLERFCNSRLLIAHRFFAWTGLLPGNVHFVDKRHEKAEVCRDLCLDAFADDRGEVLYHLKKIVPKLVWFNPTARDQVEWCWSAGAKIVKNWSELSALAL